MPALYETEVQIKQREVDGIFNVNAKETPFVSQLKTTKKAKNILTSWGVDQYADTEFGGVMEGTDVTEFNSEAREVLAAYLQIFRDPWMITDLTDLTAVEALKSEKGEQRMKSFIRLRKAFARATLGTGDTQKQSGASTPYLTRGAFSWLDPDEQATLPVPASYRPATEYAGTMANFKPSTLETALLAAAAQVDQAITLQGHVGLTLKSRMSEWGQRDEDADSGELARVQYNLDGSKKELCQIVDRFVFEAGTVYNMVNFNLARNSATGAATAASSRSGIFIKPELWKKRFMMDFAKRDLPDGGGGPRGYTKCVGGVLCMNPRGQFRALIES